MGAWLLLHHKNAFPRFRYYYDIFRHYAVYFMSQVFFSCIILLLKVAPLTLNQMSEVTEILTFILTKVYLLFKVGNQCKLPPYRNESYDALRCHRSTFTGRDAYA
jgi:hypothetical protein